jgi:hypothetical protein
MPGAGAPATGAKPAGASAAGGNLPEPAQPVFSRYWLHGKGPAPAGNLPVAVHLSPGTVPLDDGQPAVLQLTAACGPAAAAGTIRLSAPDDVVLEPAGPFTFDLAPLGHHAIEITAAARPGAGAGRRFVTAQISDSAGQVIEDSALLTIGQPPEPRVDLPLAEVVAMQEAAQTALDGEVEVSLMTPALAIRPGGRSSIEVRVRNQAASQIRGEAQLLSPFGSWEQTTPWTTDFAVDPGREETLQFAVRIPPAARPGEQWWALVKIMYFGRLVYTEAAEVTVG